MIKQIFVESRSLYGSRRIRFRLAQLEKFVGRKRMQASLVNDALLMAIWKRKPAKGLVWHTDRGNQHASHSHRKILKDHHSFKA